jgi:hypothetical protein
VTILMGADIGNAVDRRTSDGFQLGAYDFLKRPNGSRMADAPR